MTTYAKVNLRTEEDGSSAFRVFTSTSKPSSKRKIWKSIRPVLHFSSRTSAEKWVKEAGHILVKE